MLANTIRYFAAILSDGRCIVAAGTDRDEVWSKLEESLDKCGDYRTSILAIETIHRNF